MNKHDFYELVSRVSITIALLVPVEFLLDHQNSVAYKIGRAVFVGTIIATLSYGVDCWRGDSKKN